MSLGGGRGAPQVMKLSEWTSQVTLPCDLSLDAFDVTYHPVEHTHACENITFPQLRLRPVIRTITAVC